MTFGTLSSEYLLYCDQPKVVYVVIEIRFDSSLVFYTRLACKRSSHPPGLSHSCSPESTIIHRVVTGPFIYLKFYLPMRYPHPVPYISLCNNLIYTSASSTLPHPAGTKNATTFGYHISNIILRNYNTL